MPDNTLQPQHQKRIDDSAITATVADARGYRTVTTKAELERLGFSNAQRRVPALLIPIWSVHGEIATYQVRPDEPRIKDGKAIKYETPAKTRMSLDVPPGARQWLGDPSRPLFITEGARKADSAVSRNLCCISVLGVWNWRGSNEHGGKLALPDWESVALNGREVFLVFDSDVMTKVQVYSALSRLKGFLETRQATVKLIYLPSGDGAVKVGLDDFFAAGGAVDDLLPGATEMLRPSPGDESRRASIYSEQNGRIVYAKTSANDDCPTFVPLCEFTARIVGDMQEDDGVETRRVYKVQARIGEKVISFDVASSKFASLSWVPDNLGAKAIMRAGVGLRQHIPVAIQELSDQIEECRIFTHTGWRKVNGEWIYLHAGGAIGRNGPVNGIVVNLQAPLDGFVLPPAGERSDRVDAVRESLALVTAGLAGDRIMFPLLAATYRAPLGSADFTPHICGTTGSRKTELAALVQRHFGQGLDAQNLPANWSSTANSLRETLFLAKDAVVVIDDFIPGGGRNDVRRYHAKADEVLRATGNRAGRDRMNADGTLRPPRPPRGLPVSTGEDIMTGHSLRARTLILEVGNDEVNLKVLTERQAAGPAYSKAMSAFIQWLAPQRDEVRGQMDAAVAKERDALIGSLPHGRTAVIGGQLLYSLAMLFQFAEEVGAIDAEQHHKLGERARVAVVEILMAQVQHQEHADPALFFLELIAGALHSGAAHLADIRHGEVPCREDVEDEAIARLCGWRHSSDEYTDENGSVRTRTEWRPGGLLIGYVDAASGDVYLLPGPAYQAAQRAAEAGLGGITVGQKMLSRAFDELGLLASKDGSGDRTTKKKECAGKKRNTHHFRLSVLLGTESGTSGTTAANDPEEPIQPDQFPIPVPEEQAEARETGTENGNLAGSKGQFEGLIPEGPEVPDLSDKGPESRGMGAHGSTFAQELVDSLAEHRREQARGRHSVSQPTLLGNTKNGNIGNQKQGDLDLGSGGSPESDQELGSNA